MTELTTETLVIGGGLAGVAAAVAAARDGRRVLLVERRTYLGAELTATLRPWLTESEYHNLRERFALPADFAINTGTEWAVVPDRLKTGLEDCLLAAGVTLLYAMRPVALQGSQVDLAGKAGRLTVSATTVIDTRAAATAPLRRTIELLGVRPDLLGAAPLPPDCRVHLGHLADGQGHVLVEHTLALPRSESPLWRNDAELAARPASMALARWLKENHPAFAGARPTDTSHELTLPDCPQPAAIHLTVDVLVVGGGSSGAAAAIGAARSGAKTLLADMNPGLGGTGTFGGVDSYWFGRRGGFNAEVARWVAEQQSWMDLQGNKWNTEAKQLAWQNGATRAGVQILLNTVLVDVRTTAGGRVTGALLATPDCLVEVTAAVTIDATGDGDVAVRAGAEAVYGSDREGATMWYSMAPHLTPGMTKNNFTSAVDVGDPCDYTRAILSARRRLPGHDHGPYIAPRESRHVLGEVRLTLTDILTMRRWPDVINLHFSNHDIKGPNCSDWLRMGLIPPNLEVQIPYRMLLPQKVDGLLVTGKAISATHDALPPIRMQADLENLGYICGVAAARCAGEGITPRQLDVPRLQAELIKMGLLPASALDEAPPSEASMQDWINALDDSDLLYQYGEMEMDEVRRAPIPIVQVCTAGPAIVPLLRAALNEPGARGRLHSARALAWYGDKAATPVLLAEIARHLTGDELPRRTAHIRYTQASPDHGAMPALAYLLHSLAMARDEAAIPVLEQVVARLHPTRERFEDQMSGVFDYVDAVCNIAERLGHPGCLPALQRLAAFPLFRDQVCTAPVQPDYFAERQAWLEIVIARALARCGDPKGADTLTNYLKDARRPLGRHAHAELMAIQVQRRDQE